ncbi:antirestriction protein ArdA [Sinomonas albida]|uniref:antirestriction protein ArdA n=1 Tax=Sinomonas albida TaxID=369942 RepID=UPI0030169533
MTHEHQPTPEKQPPAPEPKPETPERERDPDRIPRIYVASLADYVNGRLHGTWIDATIGAEAIHQQIQAMLATSKEPAAEEWAIHDYENFGPLRLGEYESIEYVAAVAEQIDQYGEAFAAWLDYTSLDQADWGSFEESYLGEFNEVTDYVQRLIDDLGYEKLLDDTLPATIRPYIRIALAAMAEDLHQSGDIFSLDTDDGTVYVFTSHW